MIYINQSGTDVKISIEHGLKSTDTKLIALTFQCSNLMYAELLTSQLEKKLEAIIIEVRKEEYERGWKDAKAKRKKANWFGGVLRKIF